MGTQAQMIWDVWQERGFSVDDPDFIWGKQYLDMAAKVRAGLEVKMDEPLPEPFSQDEMSVLRKLMWERRSIRDWVPNEEVPDHMIEQILEAGRAAPNGCNLCVVRFAVIKDPKEQMDELLKKANAPYGGVSCFLKILFKRKNTSETHEYIVHARHGEGSARTSGARAMAVLRLSQSMVNAHVILMGHLHGQESPDIPQRLILKSGKIKSFETIATMTGAWVKAYMQGVPPCYLERWGSPPSTPS